MASQDSSFETLPGRDLRELRRHARYIVGDQSRADAMADQTIAIMAGKPIRSKSKERPKLRNLRAFYHLHNDLLQSDLDVAFSVLSLETLEGFSALQVQDILDASETRPIPAMIKARRKVPKPFNRRVMIIEDEALLAMELSETITLNDNLIVGIARTRAQAIECAKRVAPDLIISDLSLADGSSGLHAISSMKDSNVRCPVIILTGTPELVLRGDAGEPAYILEKPHTEDQLLLMMSLALRDGALQS